MRRVGDKRPPVIEREWFRLMPGRSLPFWIRVEAEVKRQRVRRRDFEKVGEIARRLANSG